MKIDCTECTSKCMLWYQYSDSRANSIVPGCRVVELIAFSGLIKSESIGTTLNRQLRSKICATNCEPGKHYKKDTISFGQCCIDYRYMVQKLLKTEKVGV